MNDYQVKKFIIGLAFVIFIIKFFKRYLRIPRPSMEKGGTFGMPSTRAASLFYIAIFLMLTCNLTKNTVIILFTIVIICCMVKYFMKEHYLMQLIIGAVIGSIIGYISAKI